MRTSASQVENLGSTPSVGIMASNIFIFAVLVVEIIVWFVILVKENRKGFQLAASAILMALSALTTYFFLNQILGIK